jgi:hypothetical protein
MGERDVDNGPLERKEGEGKNWVFLQEILSRTFIFER